MNTEASNRAPKSQKAAPEPVVLSPTLAAHYLSISRGTLYRLLDINDGPIRSTLLRKRGHERGKRLIYRDSLDTFIQVDRPPQDRDSVCPN